MNNKKGMSAWIWILIILFLLVVGAAAYFWFSGDGISPIAGNNIPQPPALPN